MHDDNAPPNEEANTHDLPGPATHGDAPDVSALQAERDALAAALQGELEAALESVPAHIRPLLEKLPATEALSYLRQHSAAFGQSARPAPSLDAGAAGERTPPLNLSPAQARLLDQARRQGYRLDMAKMARRRQ